MRTVFLVLLLWAVACAHPVPGREPAHPSTQQEDTASEDYINQLGGGDGRYPPPSAERGDSALTGDLAGGNAVVEEHGGRDKGSNVGEAQHLNWVDHKDMSAQDGNSLGFLEGDARDDGDNEAHHGTGVNGLPFRDSGLLDEEDESGDDTFEENGEEAEGEGPTYVAGADGEGERGYDVGRGDPGAGGWHGDSSSSSSSESVGVEHRRYRNYERTYRWGGGSSSSQEEEEEEGYNFEDEAMQGDDPSVFDGPGSSYKGHRAARSSRESGREAGSHHWEEGDSRSPEVRDTDSEEDSPSVEDKSQSEEVVASPSEEDSTSPSREDGEDSPSREDEDSKSQEDTSDQSDEEPGDSPEDNSQEVVSTSRSREVQEDQESAEDRSAPSTPDSESVEDEGDQSKSREDDGDQSQSPEDSVEDSKEDENDSDSHGDVPSTSAESQSASPEDATSQEDNAGEDSSSPESNDSESQEDDDEESHSQEDATRESSSHGDNSSPQSLESGSRKRRPGAYRNKPAADYDDNDCQDGY
ncbi:dentin matrix acidic phosphoprotein 1 [Porphyrio hochstetteri]